VRALLDTHVVLRWFAGKGELSPRQRQAIEAAGPRDPLLLSDISLWEVATLYELGRIRLSIPLREWLERVVGLPEVRRVGISPAVAAEVAALPATFQRDPADRIIVASARVFGATLMTSDRRIVESRLVPTLA
jgi:PIN domain nuclease of toxin-antitoxin system